MSTEYLSSEPKPEPQPEHDTKPCLISCGDDLAVGTPATVDVMQPLLLPPLILVAVFTPRISLIVPLQLLSDCTEYTLPIVLALCMVLRYSSYLYGGRRTFLRTFLAISVSLQPPQEGARKFRRGAAAITCKVARFRLKFRSLGACMQDKSAGWGWGSGLGRGRVNRIVGERGIGRGTV